MDSSKKITTEWPGFIRFFLWGSPSKKMALRWMQLSLVAAVAAIIFQYWALCATTFLVALSYWYSIKWVDKNSAWPAQPKNSKALMLGVVLISIAAVLVLFFIDYYHIPQNGMYPSLPASSKLFVNKHAYWDTSNVKRGDIVVFLRNENEQTYTYIWRVIALPGETVEASGETLIVNGQTAQRKSLGEKDGKRIFREQIGDAAYDIALDTLPEHIPPSVSVTVPPDQFFVMGDNRFNARDSRYFGPILFNSIIGKKLIQ